MFRFHRIAWTYQFDVLQVSILKWDFDCKLQQTVYHILSMGGVFAGMNSMVPKEEILWVVSYQIQVKFAK